MTSHSLAHSYFEKARKRLRALTVLFEDEAYSDVVREAQEIVELALKGLLRSCAVEAPRIHDVSDVLVAEQERLPPGVRAEVDRLAAISRDLRRDRELAFYGAEDLTPSSFYTRDDAVRAREGARRVVRVVKPAAHGAGD